MRPSWKELHIGLTSECLLYLQLKSPSMSPETTIRLNEIEYHASRILILIRHSGSPLSNPRIKGRTLL